MPWVPSDASRFTKKANTLRKKNLWSKVANRTLARTGRDDIAVKSANAAVRRAKK